MRADDSWEPDRLAPEPPPRGLAVAPDDDAAATSRARGVLEDARTSSDQDEDLARYVELC
jgi:hypothetical protein